MKRNSSDENKSVRFDEANDRPSWDRDYTPPTDRLKAQANELKALLRSVGVSPTEMARMIEAQPSTLDKYTMGQMPASKMLMAAVRSKVQYIALTRNMTLPDGHPEKGIMERKKLVSELLGVSSRLSNIVSELEKIS